jgi:DNA helicase INO80
VSPVFSVLWRLFADTQISASEVQGDTPETSAPAGATLEDVDPSVLREIDFDDG